MMQIPHSWAPCLSGSCVTWYQMEDLLDTRGIGWGWGLHGGVVRWNIHGTQIGKQSEIVFDFADVFVGIGPRFTAVEPSRVAPQCLQGLILEKYCVSVLVKVVGKRVLPNLARFTPYTCHHITGCMQSWLISLREAQDILCYIFIVVWGYKES